MPGDPQQTTDAFATPLLPGPPRPGALAAIDSLRRSLLGPCDSEFPRVPGHELLNEVGRGGMGVVYRARHLALKRIVALKMLPGGYLAEDRLRQALRIEAEAVARLQHPNIVQVHDVGEADGRPFLSLEFVEGGGLDRQLAKAPMATADAASLIELLARAMAYAHDRGVVHRDLKPANVLMADSRTPKITDFGLAKLVDGEGSHTRTGAVVGTPSYMAPEQAAGQAKHLGPLADIYSLGAILYETLTGRPPFRAATTLETLDQVRSREPVPPTRLQPGVPADLQTICLKCLEKSPDRRYRTATDLADDLRRFLDGRIILARPVGPIARAGKWARRRPATAALVGLSITASIAGLVGLAWHESTLRAQVKRADEKEAEARRQRNVALDNFRKAHVALDEIYSRLETDSWRIDDSRSIALRTDLVTSTLHYYEQVLRDSDDPDPDVRLGRGLVYLYAGRLRGLLKDKVGERRDLAEAERRLGELVADLPDVAIYQRELAYAKYRLASAFFESDRAFAEAELKRARDLVAPLAVGPNRLIERRLLGLCHMRLAQIVGPSPTLSAHAQSAIEVWSALTAEVPTDAEYRLWLIITLHQVGLGHMLARDGGNLELIRNEAALAFGRERTPITNSYDQSAAGFLAELDRFAGTLAYLDNRPVEALENYEAGIALLVPVLKGEPKHWSCRMAMAGLSYGRAKALKEVGRIDDSLAEWDRAVEWAEGHPTATDVADAHRIERVKSLVDAGRTSQARTAAIEFADRPKSETGALFELAAVFVRIRELTMEDGSLALVDRARRMAEFAGRAFACLERCASSGFFKDRTRADDLRTAPRFRSIRDLPAFQKLIEGL